MTEDEGESPGLVVVVMPSSSAKELQANEMVMAPIPVPSGWTIASLQPALRTVLASIPDGPPPLPLSIERTAAEHYPSFATPPRSKRSILQMVEPLSILGAPHSPSKRPAVVANPSSALDNIFEPLSKVLPSLKGAKIDEPYECGFKDHSIEDDSKVFSPHLSPYSRDPIHGSVWADDKENIGNFSAKMAVRDEGKRGLGRPKSEWDPDKIKLEVAAAATAEELWGHVQTASGPSLGEAIAAVVHINDRVNAARTQRHKMQARISQAMALNGLQAGHPRLVLLGSSSPIFPATPSPEKKHKSWERRSADIKYSASTYEKDRAKLDIARLLNGDATDREVLERVPLYGENCDKLDQTVRREVEKVISSLCDDKRFILFSELRQGRSFAEAMLHASK